MTGLLMNRILVIVPAYNEQSSIANIIKDIRERTKESDILVVNDSSTDKTAETLDALKVNHIDMAFNVGIGGAIQTGMRYAIKKGYDITVRVDGDGQHDPGDINKLVNHLLHGEADLVVGSRFMEKGGFKSTFMRRIGISFLNFLCSGIRGPRINDITSGFHGYNRKAMLAIQELYPHDFPEPEIIVIMKKLGLRIKEIPVKMNPRTKGVSSIRGFKALFYIIKVTLAIIVVYLRRYNEQSSSDI